MSGAKPTDAFAAYLRRMEIGLDCAGRHEASDFADMGDLYAGPSPAQLVADDLAGMIERCLFLNRDVVVALLAALIETARGTGHAEVTVGEPEARVPA